jgi:hypothetical protein
MGEIRSVTVFLPKRVNLTHGIKMFANQLFSPNLSVRGLAVAATAFLGIAATAAPLPAFTFDPAAVGLTGSTFTADNLLISDYAKVVNSGLNFTESGYLAITNAQLGGTTFEPSGLGTTYGLYVSFKATGTTGYSFGTAYGGNVDTLTYTLFGYNGLPSFSPTSAPAPFVTLAKGTLGSGTFSGTRSGSDVTGAGSLVGLSLEPDMLAANFFVSPKPFYVSAEAAFNNTGSQITNTSDGFTIRQGGGSINFVAAPVPEPESYAMLLAGLGVMGAIAFRRNKSKAD